MSRIVLHIGIEKTGCAKLQRFFARHRKALRVLGVRYPSLAGPEKRAIHKHLDLVAAAAGAPAGEDGQAPYGTVDDVLDRHLRGGKKARVTVLSAEELSRPIPNAPGVLAPLAEAMETRLVVYLRRQDEWALSVYRKRVADPTSAEARPFAEWLAAPETLQLLDFDSLLGRWEAAFGPGNMRVLRFPHDRPVVASFVRAAELPAAVGLIRDQNGRVDESVSDDVVLAALTRNGGKPELPALSQEERDDLLAMLAPANEAVRRRYFPEHGTLFGMS